MFPNLKDKYYADRKVKMEERAVKAVSKNPNTSMSLDQISEQIVALFKAQDERLEHLFNEKRFPHPGSVSQASGVPEGIECGYNGTLLSSGNCSQSTASSPVLLTEQGTIIKVQKDHMEELLKRSLATGNISRVSGDCSEDVLGGSIWSMRGTEIRPSKLVGDNEYLGVAPHAYLTTNFKVQEDRKEQLLKCSSAIGILSRVSGDSEDNFIAQEDRMEELSKHSSTTGSLSRVAGDSADIYGGSIWAQHGTKIHSVYIKLIEVMNSWWSLLKHFPQLVLTVLSVFVPLVRFFDSLFDYTLDIVPQVVPGVLCSDSDSDASAVGVGPVSCFKIDSVASIGSYKSSSAMLVEVKVSSVAPGGSTDPSFATLVTPQEFGVEASGGSEGAVVSFDIVSYTSHNMHGDVEFCRSALVDFDPTRRMQMCMPNGEVVSAEGCGRLIEGGLLTKEVWCVPAIGNRGLLSTWPCTDDEGVICIRGGPDQLVFQKDGNVIAKGYAVPEIRKYQIQFNLRSPSPVMISSHEIISEGPSHSSLNDDIIFIVPLPSLQVQSARDTSVGEPPPLIDGWSDEPVVDFRGVHPNKVTTMGNGKK
jgi:hypothetical protein